MLLQPAAPAAAQAQLLSHGVDYEPDVSRLVDKALERQHLLELDGDLADALEKIASPQDILTEARSVRESVWTCLGVRPRLSE